MPKQKVYFNEFNVIMDKAAYLPIASGLLYAYARKSEIIRTNYEFMPFLFLRGDISEIAASYDNPSVASFSTSMWNEQLNLRLAKQIKRCFPGCLIIFGGPQVPHDSEYYFRQYPFIDITVRGDGEKVFSALLERFVGSSDFSGIPNISWRNPANRACVQNKTASSGAASLDSYPSPYLEGLFDYLLLNSGDMSFQAIIETNRGCPFNCSYCVWGKGGLNKKLRYHTLSRVTKEIEWCGKHRIKYIFNADSNFGINKRDMGIARALRDTKKKYGYPEKFRACFSKNSDAEIFKIGDLLFENDLTKGVTLSFQSMDKEVIRNVGRHNIKLSTYKTLLEKFNDKNIPVYTELIAGLPGENFETWVKGIEEILEAGLRGQLFIYCCEVYPNTELSQRDYQRKFGIRTQRIILTETHGVVRTDSSVPEYQDIIVATKSMPLSDWRRMMVVSWMAMLLHSLKMGNFILLYLFHRFGIKFTGLIGYICENKLPADCSILREELAGYDRQLTRMLAGNGRCVTLPSYGNVYWDVEEASFLRISEKIDDFYNQLTSLLLDFLFKSGVNCNIAELTEVIQYQRMRMPTLDPDVLTEREFSFDFPEYFSRCIKPGKASLKASRQKMKIFPKDYAHDKAGYARKVIMWGRKSNSILLDSKWTTTK